MASSTEPQFDSEHHSSKDNTMVTLSLFDPPLTLIPTVRHNHPLLHPLQPTPLSPTSSPTSSPTHPFSIQTLTLTPPESPTSQPPFTITVSDPQKESDPAPSLLPGANSFITYLITTRTPDSAQPFSVRRRFRDFVALADRLAESFRGFVIPPRPDKSVVESQVMQKQDFVEQRRSALEKYLYRLAEHPVIGQSEELRGFLEVNGKWPLPGREDVGTRVLDGAVRLPRQLFGSGEGGGGYRLAPQDVVQPAKGGRDLLRMFRELKQSVANDWGGGKMGLVEEDKLFLERKERVLELEQLLSSASLQAEALVKAQQDMSETMGEMGLTFFKLGKFETEGAIYESQRIRATDFKLLATAIIKASRAHRESNALTMKHLDKLHQHYGLMLAVHHAFSDRASALITLQTILSDLSSLRLRKEKLEAASSMIFGGDKTRARKLDELKETIISTENAKIIAFKEYERIKDNNRSELDRLDRERRKDFFDMIKGFVVNQAAYAEKLAGIWTQAAGETSRYADRTN